LVQTAEGVREQPIPSSGTTFARALNSPRERRLGRQASLVRLRQPAILEWPLAK